MYIGGINLLHIKRPGTNIYSEFKRVTPQTRLLLCIYVVVIMQSHCCIVGCGWVFCADPSNFRQNIMCFYVFNVLLKMNNSISIPFVHLMDSNGIQLREMSLLHDLWLLKNISWWNLSILIFCACTKHPNPRILSMLRKWLILPWLGI
jgi:hypothetical protein